MSLARKVTVNASLLVGGRITTAALGIVSIGISTRYLGVSDFGALAAALAVATLLNPITDAGIWTIGAREIAKRPEQTRRIFGCTLTVGFALSLFGVLVGLGVAFLLYGGSEDALTREAVLLLLLTVPLSAPFGAVNAFFISQQRAWMGALGTVTSSVVQLIGIALVAVADWGFTGVVLAYLVAILSQGVLMLVLARGKVSLRPRWDSRVGRELLRWSLPLSGAAIVHALYWRIDIMLLSVLAANSEVGLYGLSYRIVDALVVLPPFVMITLLPEFARLGERRERLREVAQKAFSVMQVGALGLLAIVAGFAHEIVVVIGGDEFAGAAPVLQLLMVGVALTFVGNVLANVMIAVNRQTALFKMTLLVLPFNVGLNLALIPLWGAVGAAAAFAASELLHLLCLALIYRGYTQLPRPTRGLQVLVAAALAGLVAAAKLLPFVDELAPIVVLGAGVPLAVAAYLGALYALDAMPREIHTHLLLPAWKRARRLVRA